VDWHGASPVDVLSSDVAARCYTAGYRAFVEPIIRGGMR